LSEERWLPVPGWDEYEVSDYGRVRRLTPGRGTRAGRILKASPDAWGYPRVALSRSGEVKYEKAHRLVLLAFVGPCPVGMEARHLNGDRADPSLSNLAWGTPKENSADTDRHGTRVVGERHYQAKLTSAMVLAMRRGELSAAEAADRSGVNPRTSRSAKSGDAWKAVANG